MTLLLLNHPVSLHITFQWHFCRLKLNYVFYSGKIRWTLQCYVFILLDPGTDPFLSLIPVVAETIFHPLYMLTDPWEKDYGPHRSVRLTSFVHIYSSYLWDINLHINAAGWNGYGGIGAWNPWPVIQHKKILSSQSELISELDMLSHKVQLNFFLQNLKFPCPMILVQ